MWTAGCCIWSDPKNGEIKKFQSIAVIGNNHALDTLTSAITVSELQRLLKDPKVKNHVDLFPGQPACSDPGNAYILKTKAVKG